MSWAWLFVAYFLYKIIMTAIENERLTKVAKVEADLKLKLAKRLEDPELVERIVGSRLDADGEPIHDESKEGAAARREAAAWKHGDWNVSSKGWTREASGRRDHQKGAGLVLTGLICFLVGVAFCVAAAMTGPEGLWLPGLIVCAVGLAFLTFATSRPQIERQLRGSSSGSGTKSEAVPAEDAAST